MSTYSTGVTIVPPAGDTAASYTIYGNTFQSIGGGPTPGGYTDFAYSLDAGASWIPLATNIGMVNSGSSSESTITWNPPHAIFPNSAGGTVKVRAIGKPSTSGSTIYAAGYRDLNLTVPASVVPTLASVAFAETTTSPAIAALVGAGNYVQSWSRLTPTITSAGASGSTVTATAVSLTGQVTQTGVAFGAAVALSGAVPYTAQVADSRGRQSAIYYGTVTVKAWNVPFFNTPLVARTSDAAGATPSSTGTYLKITPSASASSLNFGAGEKNLLEWQVRTRPVGGAWTTVQAWTATTVSGVTWTTPKVIAGYPSNTAFDVEVSVRDWFGKNGYIPVSVLIVTVPTESVYMDWDTDGVGFGKYHTQGSIDAAGRIYQQGGEQIMPVGMIGSFPGTTSPSGWLLCNGSAVSRTTYAALFAYLGTGYGVGDGSTTFNLPDYRGRTLVGLDAGQTEFSSVGTLGGDKNLAKHRHSAISFASGSNLPTDAPWTVSTAVGATGTTFSLTGEAGTGNAGNLQPYAVVLHCIKF